MDRALLLIAFCVLVCVLIVGGQWMAKRRLSTLRNTESTAFWNILGAGPDGRTMVIAFSSPSCAVCHGVQAQALTDIENELGRGSVRVMKVDVADKPHVARAFGVMTVPTTVVLTPNGSVVVANHGVALAPKLIQQVQVAAAA